MPTEFKLPSLGENVESGDVLSVLHHVEFVEVRLPETRRLERRVVPAAAVPRERLEL